MEAGGNSEDTPATSSMGVRMSKGIAPRSKKEQRKWKKDGKKKLQALDKAFSGTTPRRD